MHKQRCGRRAGGARTVARLLDRLGSSRASRARSAQHIHVANAVRGLWPMQHARRRGSLPGRGPESGAPRTRLRTRSIAPSNAQRRSVPRRLRCVSMLHRTTRWEPSGWAPAECATRPACEAVCETRASAACSHTLRDDATSTYHARGSGRAANNRGAQNSARTPPRRPFRRPDASARAHSPAGGVGARCLSPSHLEGCRVAWRSLPGDLGGPPRRGGPACSLLSHHLIPPSGISFSSLL